MTIILEAYNVSTVFYQSGLLFHHFDEFLMQTCIIPFPLSCLPPFLLEVNFWGKWHRFYGQYAHPVTQRSVPALEETIQN